jgi:hypothetical protein
MEYITREEETAVVGITTVAAVFLCGSAALAVLSLMEIEIGIVHKATAIFLFGVIAHLWMQISEGER